MFEIGERFAGIQVWDDLGEQWPVTDFIDLPTGQSAALLRAPSADGVSSITVTFPIGATLGVVGLGGVTVSAWDAAKRENDAIASEVSRLQQAASQGPKTDPSVNSPHERASWPRSAYRIDVRHVLVGEISKQDKSGRSWWWRPGRTKPRTHLRVPPPRCRPGGNCSSGPRGTAAAATAPLRCAGLPSVAAHQADMFHPDAERYLGGYEPAQSEAYRFCDTRCARISVRITLPRWPRPMASICGRRPAARPAGPAACAAAVVCRWRGRLHSVGSPVVRRPASLELCRRTPHAACRDPERRAAPRCSSIPRPGTGVFAGEGRQSAARGRAFAGRGRSGPRGGEHRARCSRSGFPTAGEPSPAGLVVGDLLVNTPASVGGGFSETTRIPAGTVALGSRAGRSPRAAVEPLWVRGAGAGWLLAV